MSKINTIPDYTPIRFYPQLSRVIETDKIIDNTSFSIENIIDKSWVIDFDILIRFLKKNNSSVNNFFKEKEHIEKILFPFFDYLRYTFFSNNKIIWEHVESILRDNQSVRDGIVLYIREKNSDIISSQNIEQYDTISFHLFLLWMEQDFDLIKDVQSEHFTRIKSLFSDTILKICRLLGVMDVWGKKNPPEALTRELENIIQLGETINKLALIHSVNFERRQISFELGNIIRNNIDALVRQLDQEFIQDHSIGKKLRYLSWKVQCNFAHGVIIDGLSTAQIEEQVAHIRGEQNAWFDRQKASDFWWDSTEEESSRIVLMGNETITNLVGIERIEGLHWKISTKLRKEKGDLLDNLTAIYSYGVGRDFISRESVIADFTKSGITNEYQIEVIHYIVLFDTMIQNASLVRLMEFFLEGNKHMNNFFYEEFVIKIIAQIIKRLQDAEDSSQFAIIVDKIYTSLKAKNISYSILSYSKVYLALAIYYIKCPDNQYIEHAKKCFLHYKNLDESATVSEKMNSNIEEERLFFWLLWERDEVERYRKQVHHHENLEISGSFIFERATERYNQEAILWIEAKIANIMASMNTGDDTYSQNQIDFELGKRIAESIFYNLCTITVIGDCYNCNEDSSSSECAPAINSPETRVDTCPLVPLKRGFEKTVIPLSGGVYIIFIYASISKKIFENIFRKQQSLIEQRFGNLIAINNKNTQLQKSKMELEKLAFYDIETGLPNENKLNKDINGQERAVVLIEALGYSNMMATQGGKDDWIEIIKTVSSYLEIHADMPVYRYDKTTLCLAYRKDAIVQMASLLNEEADKAIYVFMDALLTNFQLEYGRNLQFRGGIVLPQKKEHLKYAHIALAKAKSKREKYLYVFNDGDEKSPEEARKSTEILVAALDHKNTSTKLVPHYQVKFDPNEPKILHLEALARIEHTSKDGEMELIGPYRFIEIAERKRWLSDIALMMIHQIVEDMRIHTDMHVSLNLHEQDWNDDRILMALRWIKNEGKINVNRISLEILETVPFDRIEDVEKIDELKALWYQISIDDYGQAQSNLKKIMLIRPNNIKIDEVIIKALSKDKTREDAINAVKSVVFHAGLIGATVTAEYIETKEVYETLLSLGVNLFQWYYFAKPLPIEEIIKGR